MDEPALYESRAWFQTTLSSIGDGVIATDRTGRVVFLNPSAAALTGWPDAEALGTAITTVVHLVDARTRAVVDNPVTTVLREGTVVGLPHQTLLIARDGVAYPIDDSAAPIRNPQGQLLGAVLVFRDLTERQRADEAQARLAAIVDSADDAIISKTMAGIITSWNRGAEQLYGYTAAEMIGQPIARLIPPELADDFPRIMARLRRGERLEHYETQRLAKDGTRIDVALTISPLRDRTGQIIGASKIARDITARKQADAELARRRAETALLAALTQQLSASLELDTVLQRVARGAQTLCGSARVILALRDPDADVLVVRQAIGIPLGTYANVRLAPGQGLGGQVLRTGQPWRTEDYAADPRFEHVTPAAARVAAPWAVLAAGHRSGRLSLRPGRRGWHPWLSRWRAARRRARCQRLEHLWDAQREQGWTQTASSSRDVVIATPTPSRAPETRRSSLTSPRGGGPSRPQVASMADGGATSPARRPGAAKKRGATRGLGMGGVRMIRSTVSTRSVFVGRARELAVLRAPSKTRWRVADASSCWWASQASARRASRRSWPHRHRSGAPGCMPGAVMQGKGRRPSGRGCRSSAPMCRRATRTPCARTSGVVPRRLRR